MHQTENTTALKNLYQIVEGVGLLQKLFVGEGSAVGDDVGGRSVDEVAHWVVSVVQHLVYILQLEKYHKFDSQQRVILGPDFIDVVISLIGDDSELLELESSVNFFGFVVWICSVPFELVRPLVGLGNVAVGAVQNDPLDSDRLLRGFVIDFEIFRRAGSRIWPVND